MVENESKLEGKKITGHRQKFATATQKGGFTKEFKSRRNHVEVNTSKFSY